MTKTRESLSDESLEGVVGGLMNFNYKTKVLTYTHEESGEVSTYQILNFSSAWARSNEMHAMNIHEDAIIADLKGNGFIA